MLNHFKYCFANDSINPSFWRRRAEMEMNQGNNNNLTHIFYKLYITLYPVKIYKLAVLYIINIKFHLTVKKAQVQ